MEFLEIALALLCVVAALSAVSHKIPIPRPILHVAGGVMLSFAPGFNHIQLDPNLFFALFIPPLLFADGWQIPKRDFAKVMRPVLLLALGLVALTILVVGYLVHALIPSIPLAAAFALGAIISPTDAVAVAAIIEKLKMPSRITYIVNGESLINDASALVAFKFAVAAVLTGMFSWQDVALNFVLLSGGGILTGFTVAWLISKLRLWLAQRVNSEPPVQTTLSLLTPFAAYFAAESLQVSGILAVVISGIYAGIHDTRHLTTEDRLQTWEVWRMVLFVFNGLAFILLGLQLPAIMTGLEGYHWSYLVGYPALLAATVILLRLLWVFPAAYIPRWLFPKIGEREGPPRPANLLVLGWSGVRGSITLAAALSLPLTTSAGLAFPERDLLIYLASSVIVITLLLHGFTLPWLIKWLNITTDGIAEREERMARTEVARAAIQQIKQHMVPESSPYEKIMAAQLIASYEHKIQYLAAQEDIVGEDVEMHIKIERNLRLNVLNAEREELFRLHKRKAINEEVLRSIQREIDYLEASLLAPRQNSG